MVVVFALLLWLLIIIVYTYFLSWDHCFSCLRFASNFVFCCVCSVLFAWKWGKLSRHNMTASVSKLGVHTCTRTTILVQDYQKLVTNLVGCRGLFHDAGQEVLLFSAVNTLTLLSFHVSVPIWKVAQVPTCVVMRSPCCWVTFWTHTQGHLINLPIGGFSLNFNKIWWNCASDVMNGKQSFEKYTPKGTGLNPDLCREVFKGPSFPILGGYQNDELCFVERGVSLKHRKTIQTLNFCSSVKLVGGISGINSDYSSPRRLNKLNGSYSAACKNRRNLVWAKAAVSLWKSRTSAEACLSGKTCV